MLSLAKERKGVYRDLKVANLELPLPFSQDTYDVVVCSGVFLQGHVGKPGIPNMLNVVKVGGHVLFTIRQSWYEKDDYVTFINSLPCDIVDVSKIEYLNQVQALLITLKKTGPITDSKKAFEFDN